MNMQDFTAKNRSAMTDRIKEDKLLREQYLEEAVTLKDITAAYNEYEKIKNDPKSDDSQIKHAKAHLYYISRKYKRQRDSIGHKEETEIEKKVNTVLKEEVELLEAGWRNIKDMSLDEKETEITQLKKDMEISDGNTSPMEFALMENRLQDLEASLKEIETKKNFKLFEEEKMKDQFEYCYGVPTQKKYPLYDEKHVKSAIRLFGHVEPRFERELALAILAKMRKFNIPYSFIGDDNKLRNYLPKNSNILKEDIIMDEEELTSDDYEVMDMCYLYENLVDLKNTKILDEGKVTDALKATGTWIADKAIKGYETLKTGAKAAIKAVGGPIPAAAIAGGAALAAGAGIHAIRKHKKKKREQQLAESVISILNLLDKDTLGLLEDQDLVESYYNYTEPQTLKEDVTFIDNAGKLKTTTAVEYNTEMHKYDTKTQIPSIKIKKNKESKMLSEYTLSLRSSLKTEYNKDDPEVIKLESLYKADRKYFMEILSAFKAKKPNTKKELETKEAIIKKLTEVLDTTDKMYAEREKDVENLRSAQFNLRYNILVIGSYVATNKKTLMKEDVEILELEGAEELIESLTESVLDPVQKERCKDIFDENDVMLEKVKKQIVDQFMNWKEKIPEKFTVDAFYLIGSSSGFQYTPTSDVDITVVSHDYGDDVWDKIKDTIPNGNNLEGTEHPINYFIRNDEDEKNAENIYDILNGKWLKKTEKAKIDIHSPYIIEVSRFFMNAFDLSLKEYERDKQDYLQLKELDPSKVEISEEEHNEALSAKLTELRADLDSLRMGNHVLRSFLHEAYEDEDGIFEIHIDIKAKDDPRYSLNNLVYKTLEKYGYREKIDSTIKEAEELVEGEKTE